MTASLSLEGMSIEEKIQAMESLWDDLRTRAPDMASPDWHGEILAGRQAAIERGEEQFEDWETAKKNIKNRIS
ncbi:MAG: addiction module protein [Gammaproteobacteria bacterium]